MKEFTITANRFLNQDIKAFYHTDYVGMRNPGNPEYINTFKNTFNNFSDNKLLEASKELKAVLSEDLPQILEILQLKALTLCVVPRAKVDYASNQLVFKSTIRGFIDQHSNIFYDGIDYIHRFINTKTTHLKNVKLTNYDNGGPEPYIGITAETCKISKDVMGKNILLIDDIYTKNIDIDEDAIQALLNNGAKSVAFYAIGRTFKR